MLQKYGKLYISRKTRDLCPLLMLNDPRQNLHAIEYPVVVCLKESSVSLTTDDSQHFCFSLNMKRFHSYFTSQNKTDSLLFFVLFFFPVLNRYIYNGNQPIICFCFDKQSFQLIHSND